MKIMFFTLSLRNGGAERVVSVLANEMSKKDDVSILTVHNNVDHYKINDGIKRFYVDKDKWNEKKRFKNKLKKVSIIRLIKIVKVIKEEKPNVIIAFLPLPSLYIMLAKKYSKTVRDTPIILSERCDPSREYSNKIIAHFMRKLYKQTDGFVFQTKEAKDFFASFVKCKTAIISNPINDSFLNYKKPKVRREVIVSCGRLEGQKNFRLLIESFADVVKKHPNYKLDIYGDGSQKDELLALAEKLNIADKVNLRGRVLDIAKEIFDASVFALSSDYEGMPNALMEAMALGIPCVSTDCPVGGPRALIKNGYNGLLVKVGNKQQLAHAIVKLISDKKMATEMSKNGVEESKKYTIDNIMSEWKKIINDVVNKNG